MYKIVNCTKASRKYREAFVQLCIIWKKLKKKKTEQTFDKGVYICNIM